MRKGVHGSQIPVLMFLGLEIPKESAPKLWSVEPAEEQDCQFQNATGTKHILLPQEKLRAGGSLCVALTGKESSPRATGCCPPPKHPLYNLSETKARLFKMSGA